MTNLKRSCFFSVLLLLTFWAAFAQNEDKRLSAPLIPFIKDLLSRKGFTYPITGAAQGIVKTTYQYNQAKGQCLIKNNDQLYLFLDWTGILYKVVRRNNAMLDFIRLDSTININYNGGGWIYIYNDEIHNIGGYSFWKNNGIDKKYNNKDRQWDVVPLSEEIIPQNFPIPLLWQDPNKKVLWVPFQRIYNSGIDDPDFQNGKIIPNCYSLDLRTKKWAKRGLLNQEVLNILKNAGLYVQMEKGLMLFSSGHVYVLDFNSNSLLQLKDYSLVQSFVRIPFPSFRYVYNNTLYYYIAESGKYDSLLVEPFKFEKLAVKIYQPENPSDSSLYCVVLVILAVFSLLYFIIRKKKTNVESTASSELKDKLSNNDFTDKEQSLILLLKRNSFEKKTTSIDEINYILGVKDKNTGLQKKVRSDVMNSINEKYRIKTASTEPLVLSKRSPHDKRYLEYFILPESSPL